MTFLQAQSAIIVDSHCHLDLLEKQGHDINEVMLAADKAQVKILQTICTRVSEIDKILDYTRRYKNVFASLGVHPNNVDEEPKINALQLLKICAENKKIIGIGETGLDYYYKDVSAKNQKDSFVEHIRASQESGLPLIIHSRDADNDMMEILVSEQKNKKFPALLHCFSSSESLARKALDIGVFISISGIVTFKNAPDLQNIVKFLPLESLLVETDSPYLAPVPYRGKTNQPAYTRNVTEFVAQLKGLEWQEVAAQTTANFLGLFTGATL